MRPQIVLLSVVVVCIACNSAVLATDRLVPMTAADTNDPNLVSWWKFDEGQGSIAYDSAGNNHGTIYGATWTTGQICCALDFDGVDDYVDIPYDPSLDIDAQNGITLSVWIKLNTYPDSTHQGPIFGLYDSTDAGTKNYLAIAKSTYGNVIGWDQYPPSGGGITSIKPDLDTWYHIAVTEDSSQKAIYINGDLDVSDNITELYQGNTPDTIRIGNRADLATFYFDGTIDDVRLYNRALSAEEIRSIYDSPCPNCPPIIWISPQGLRFFAHEGGANPEAQILSIENIAKGVTLNWQVQEYCDWLQVEPNSGRCTNEVDDVNIVVDISGLNIGQYECELSVSDSNAINSPQTVTIILYVLEAGFELYVPLDYDTIQEAIDAAINGDTVVVAPGTYTGYGNRDIDFKGKAITIQSIDPEDPCIVEATVIDCNGSKADPHRGFYFHSGEGPNSVISGLTITNGYVYDANGGGIYCSGSSPTIQNCIIIDNTARGRDGIYEVDPVGKAAHGGGIYCTAGSSPLLINCSIVNNKVIGGEGTAYWLFGSGEGGSAFGGGIFCGANSSVVIIGCYLSNNEVRGGAGCDGSLDTPTTRGGDAYGGGLYAAQTSNLTIENSHIFGNRAFGDWGGTDWSSGGAWGGKSGGSAFGGGVYSDSAAEVTMKNCHVNSNVVVGGHGGGNAGFEDSPPGGPGGSAYGGGLYCSTVGTTKIENCLVTDNEAVGGDGGVGWPIGGGAGGNSIGGGMYQSSTTQSAVTNCTVVGNALSGGDQGFPYTGEDGAESGAGIYCESVLIINSIVWGNNANEANPVDGSGLAVSYSCVDQVIAGPGNIYTDPCFVAGPDGDYYLSQIAAGQAVDSPCVDAGSDTAANLGMNIFTTRTDRVHDQGIVDMGYHYPMPISINYDAEAYAYSHLNDAAGEDTDTDEDSSSNSKAMAQTHAHAEYCDFYPINCLICWFSDSYMDVSGEVVYGSDMASLMSRFKGSGSFGWQDSCNGSEEGPGGDGNGYTYMSGTLTIGNFERYRDDSCRPSLSINAKISGDGPNSWDYWDWWLKIWDDDPNKPLILLSDSNSSADLEVLAGQVLNFELYHVTYKADWPTNGLESTVVIDLYLLPFADLDNDCDVDFFDYAILTSQWKQMPGVPPADIAPPGGDSTVDGKDLASLVGSWLWGK